MSDTRVLGAGYKVLEAEQFFSSQRSDQCLPDIPCLLPLLYFSGSTRQSNNEQGTVPSVTGF